MLFALSHLFILLVCISGLYGNDVTESTETSTTNHFTSAAANRPLVNRNHTKVPRNDQLLSLLANRRRQIIQNRFKSHIKTIVELAKHGHPDNVSETQYNITNNNVTALNIHINLTELLQNTVNNSNSDEQGVSTPSTEINVINTSSPRTAYKNRKNVSINRDSSQIQENKNNSKQQQNMPIIRNILFRRKMSYLNRKLPLDFDTVAYDTLGIPEIGKTTDDLIMDAEDSLQVEESSHDKLIYYDVKNNSSKNSMNNFDDVSEETKTMSMINKTYHHNSKTPEYILDETINKNSTEIKIDNVSLDINDTSLYNTSNVNNSTNEENANIVKNTTKIRQKDNKAAKNNTHFMPQSLYNYFRPHEDVPDEEMQPFLHFGDKLPVTKQTNASRNQSLTKSAQLIIPKDKIEDNTTQKREEEIDENMDVSITKPIYENKIPKVILPSSQKPTVVQRYMKNRSHNLTKAFEARESIKNEKKNVVPISNTRNFSRHRGFRNRTIFFHQKRNGMRHTINLTPNVRITDLKPTIIENNLSMNIKLNNETQNSTSNITSENSVNNITSSKENHITKLTETTTKSAEVIDKIEIIKVKTINPLERMVKTSQSSTISTTNITPTTRILSTDVVTSISIKSSISDSLNKTKNNTTMNDSEATVIAQLNNFTSQSFKNNYSNISSLKNVSLPTPKLNTKHNRTTDVGRLPTPIFYLNKTDFIIHVPDSEITTKAESFMSENTNNDSTDTITQTNVEIVETTTPQSFDDIQIKTRFSSKEDITEKEIAYTAIVTSSPTTRSKTHETKTIKTISYTSERPNVTDGSTEKNDYTTQKTRKISTTEKKKFNLFNISGINNQDAASELPLATLFNVIDFKKNDPIINSTIPSRIIPGTETVISRKREETTTFDNIHAAYILASLGLFPMAIIVIYVIRNLMKRKNKCFEDFETELHDDKATIITPVARLPALVVDSSTKWEFPRSKLRLQTLLGQGNFGQVWKAEADDLKGHIGLTRLVAVKTIKDGASHKEREDLLKELEIMQKMGSHPNVVTLLGCCTEKEPYLLIMEYVMYGKLLTYLRDHRTRRDYFNFSDDAAVLTSRDLTVFAYCVARGMEYIESKGIVHRDLAARNILVDHNKLCKIADFGMSRDLNGDEEMTEPRQARNALPVRWMAIESLLYSVFTHKTDVWSFGVLLWEIVTLGSSPYANMSGREVMRLICEGYRLERPNHCKPELYRVMARTWHDDPDQRPTFTQLRTELAEMLENTTVEGSYVDLESFRADSTVYEIDNCTPRGNYFTVKSRFSEFECDI